jgi:hypothetical protein
LAEKLDWKGLKSLQSLVPGNGNATCSVNIV